MTEIVSFMSGSDPAGFATIMLVQCTLAMFLGLLMANRWRRNSAIQQTALKAAIACALFCPAMTLAMKVCGLTLISIPGTKAEVYTDEPIVLDSSPAAPAVESVTVNVPEVASAVTVPEILPAINSPTETIHTPILETSPKQSETIHDRPFRSLLPMVLAIWAIGVLCFIYGIVRSWWKLRRILNSTKSIEDARLVAVANQVTSILSAKSFPRVVSSTDVNCPVAAGFLHPVIILPGGLGEKLTVDELRMVLLHEAAHIRRRDHLWLLFEQMFLAVYWFHPLSHLLVRRLAQAREEVCDNYVLQCVDGPSYSESLLRLTNLLPGLSPVPGGVGLFSLRWKLEERISGLLDDRRKTMLRTKLFTSLTIVSLMALAVLPIGVTQLVAQQATPADTDLQLESFSLEASPATDSRPNNQTAAEETVNVLAIVLPDAKKAQVVWDEARLSPTDESFGKLARQHSIDPIAREHSGKIAPIRRGNSKPHLEIQAFSLSPGEVSGIIECEDKFVILRRPTSNKSHLDVTSNIIARVNGEPITIEELEAGLVKRYGKEHMGSLVRRKILEQACREKNITVSGSDITAEATRIAAKFGLTAEEFYSMLEKERNLDSSTYHSDVVWPTLVLKRLAGEEDASQYFKELEARAKVMVVENAMTLASNPNRRTNVGKKPNRIAFVNVGRVFKESVQFKERTEKLKAEVEQTQRSLQQLRSESQSLQKAVDALSIDNGNDEVKAALQKLLIQKQLQLQQAHHTAQQRFRQQESMSYLEVYRRIYDEVKSYSKEQGIELVLRDPGSPQSKSVFETIDPTSIDPRNSQEVLKKINQHVLYVDGAEEEKRLDITDAIIQRLKSKAK